jgi:hypothetical protein
MVKLTEVQTMRIKLKMHVDDLLRFLCAPVPDRESIAVTRRAIAGYGAKIAQLSPN